MSPVRLNDIVGGMPYEAQNAVLIARLSRLNTDIADRSVKLARALPGGKRALAHIEKLRALKRERRSLLGAAETARKRADPARNVKIATEYRGLKGQYGAVTEMARRYRLSREQIRRIARAHPAGEVEQVEESTSRKAEPAAALIHVPVSRLEALDLTSLLELLRRIRHALGEAAETPPEGDLFRQNDWAAALAVECLRLERELYNRQNQLISIISNRHLSR